MTKQINLRLHIVDDHIVREGISGINRIIEEKGVNGNIAGGIGVQSYIPKEQHRKTVDLDFSLLWGGSSEEFRSIITPLAKYLESAGYKIEVQKKDCAYEIRVIEDKKDDSLLIQHKIRNTKNFEKNRKSLDREMQNQRILSREGLIYRVTSPEDLVLQKTNRMLTFLESYEGLKLPEGDAMDKIKERAEAIRAKVLQHHANVDPTEVARMRLLFDCGDIKGLAHYAGLNKGYFAEGLKDWADTKDRQNKFYATLDKLEVQLR